jgi:hypothetical protein
MIRFYPINGIVMLSEAKHLGSEILRFAQNDIVNGLIDSDGDFHFLLFFWLVGFALVLLEFVGFGTKSFCPIFNLYGSSM